MKYNRKEHNIKLDNIVVKLTNLQKSKSSLKYALKVSKALKKMSIDDRLEFISLLVDENEEVETGEVVSSVADVKATEDAMELEAEEEPVEITGILSEACAHAYTFYKTNVSEMRKAIADRNRCTAQYKDVWAKVREKANVLEDEFKPFAEAYLNAAAQDVESQFSVNKKSKMDLQ